MIRTFFRLAVFGVGLAAISSVAFAADPILGNWKVEGGDIAVIAQCGGSFCATLKNGKYAGRQIGKFGGGNGRYAGTLTDPSVNKTYDGSGTLSGNAFRLKGCAMKVFCKAQTWTRL
jgi:uncharacterized protein (DUF2147 family)